MKEDSFKKKLAAYIVMSEAFLLAHPVDVNAQIMYTDVNPDVVLYHSYFNLDLNNDGVVDFKLLHSKHFITNGNYREMHIHEKNYCLNGNEAMENSFLPNFPYPFNQGDTINQNQIFGNVDVLFYRNLDSVYTAITSTAPSNWYLSTFYTNGYFGLGGGVQNQYLGLKLFSNGNTYYGWARLDVNILTDNITLKDYAINLTPDSSILAGETGIPCTILPPVTTPSGLIDISCIDSIPIHFQNPGGLSIQWMKEGQWLVGETDTVYSANQIGNYGILVSDSNCNLIINAANIILLPSLVMHETQVNATCENNNGIINLSVTGSLSPYYYSWSNGATTNGISNLNDGIYTVSVSSSSGSCILDSSFIIYNTSNAVDTPIITQQNDTLFSSFPGKNQWYYYSYTYPLFGDTLNYYIPTSFGNHFVKAIETTGCYNLSAAFNFQYNSINHIKPIEFVTLIDNKISFHLSDNILLGEEIIIYNQLGQRVASTIIENENPVLDLSLAPTGIYFYHIRSKEKYFSGKFFID